MIERLARAPRPGRARPHEHLAPHQGHPPMHRATSAQASCGEDHFDPECARTSHQSTQNWSGKPPLPSSRPTERAAGPIHHQRPCPYRGPGQGERDHTNISLPTRGIPNAPGHERQALDCIIRPSDRRGPGRDPGAAMCVQGIDVQCVLQFTLINAAGCALHRCTSRVIHRSELSFSIHDHHQGRLVPLRVERPQHFTNNRTFPARS